MPATAGAYLVAVTLNGQHIAGSRFVLQVKPSSADAGKCIASGKGLREAEVGEKARFAVQTWDSHGNITSPPLSSFRVRLVCNDSPIVIVPKGVDVGNGRYTFSYSTEVAGHYTAHVLVATAAAKNIELNPKGPAAANAATRFEPMNIAGSPFSVYIKPGPTYPPACGVRWVSPKVLTVNEPVQLVIQSRDRFFNCRDEGGDQYTLQLRSAKPLPTKSSERDAAHDLTATDGRRQVDVPVPGLPLMQVGEVTDEYDGVPGQYGATVSTKVAGEYVVVLQMAKKKKTGDGGEEGEEQGKTMTEEEKRLSAEASEADLRAEAAADAEAERIRRLHNGAPPLPKLSFFTLSVLVSRMDAWRKRGAAKAIERRRRAEQIYRESVFYEAGDTDPATCVVSGSGLWKARAKERATWTIQPRDAFSNATDEPHGSFRVRVQCDPDARARSSMAAPRSPPPDLSATSESLASISVGEGADGCALVSCLWHAHGGFLVHVTLHGKPLMGSPYKCRVAPMHSGEPVETSQQRQVTLDKFNAGAALGWSEGSAHIWEAQRGDKYDYVRTALRRPTEEVTALGSDTARSWAIAELDPHGFDVKQAEHTAGGVAGVRGRYAARKRTAMLHFRLSAMSHELMAGGVSLHAGAELGAAESGAAEPRAGAAEVEEAQAAAMLIGGGISSSSSSSRGAGGSSSDIAAASTSYGYGGVLMRCNAPDALPPADPPAFGGGMMSGASESIKASPRSFGTQSLPAGLTPRAMMVGTGGGVGGARRVASPRVSPRDSPRGSPRTSPRTSGGAPQPPNAAPMLISSSAAEPQLQEQRADEDAGMASRGMGAAGKGAGGWRKMRVARATRKLGRIDAPPVHSWRLLGPEPEPPAQPLPAALTPRAQALASRLDEQLGHISLH